MRAGVKHFASSKGVKAVGVMYQDTDYGRDVLAGAQAQVEAMGLKLGGTTGHKPTDTDFNGAVAKLRDANCDLIVLGTHREGHGDHPADGAQEGWNSDLHGQLRHLFDRGGRGAGRSGGGVLFDVAGALSLSGRSAPGGARVRDQVQADLRHRRELSRRGRLHRRELHACRTGEGGSRSDGGQLHRRDGEHEGLARHLRRPAAVAERRPTIMRPTSRSCRW